MCRVLEEMCEDVAKDVAKKVAKDVAMKERLARARKMLSMGKNTPEEVAECFDFSLDEIRRLQAETPQ